MTTNYTIPHALATLLGLAALGTQAAFLCTSTGFTLETSSMLLASVGAAVLPVLAERFWHTSKRHSLALVVPGLCLLGWVVPTVATKMGTSAETTRLAAQAHNARYEAAQEALKAARAALALAQRDQAAECKSGAGTKCKGAQMTLDNAKADLAKAEKAATGAPVPMPWLPVEHATLLPIGLELTIWACLMVGLGPLLCIERDLRREPLSEEDLDELRELHQPEDADEGEPPRLIPAPQRRPVTTRLAAERDLVWLLASGQTIPSQEWLRKRWGVENKGTVCKWLEIMEERGLCTRKQIGRQKMIVRAEPSLAA